MEPPSPSKFPMSPGMPLFAVSPERVAGTKPPYGAPTAQSPSLSDLRTSPLRKHRRNDSDISVHGLAAMFENLEVKDFKEAQAKYLQALQKQKTAHASEIRQLEKKHAHDMARHLVRIEELQNAHKEYTQLKTVHKKLVADHEGWVPKDKWDSARQESRRAIEEWELMLKHAGDQKRHLEKQIFQANKSVDAYKAKCHIYKQQFQEKEKRCTELGNRLPNLEGQVQGLQRTIKRTESDLKFHMGEAEKYKGQVYTLQVNVEAVQSQLGEEVQTLKDKLRLVEGERDALKTSLKEEEVLRIAAEGRIPLPATTTEEHDELGSPVQSPRKQRASERDEEDKENVAPKKAVVELKLAQQELATEKRLRERAQEQIEFMKMECQFRCCSCRIADSKGSHYVHDGSYATEMDRIKASVPSMTPPPSSHGDDPMEDVVIKQEPAEDTQIFTHSTDETCAVEEDIEIADQTFDSTVIVKRVNSSTPEPIVAFSPTTGTFRSVSSSNKDPVSTHDATSADPSHLELSAIAEVGVESSPWTPDAHSTALSIIAMSPSSHRSASRSQSRAEVQVEAKPNAKSSDIVIHEDALLDSDDEDIERQTPPYAPSEPATPGQYLTRTITTTTTIPLHFSPITPSVKLDNQPMTPSTVAHAPANARTPVLGELSLNKLPFDREAALEAIRQRRGRARSMAAGHGTPRKQMMEGVKERRDISAPVSRVRR